MNASGLSPAQERARAAEAMAFERSVRPATAREAHAVLMRQRQEQATVRVHAASDWLLARVPGLVTGGGMACGLAICALIGLRSERPDLAGGELLAAVIAHRDRRLAAIGAGDLIVPIPNPTGAVTS